MCAKDDLVGRKREPATAESVTAKDSNYVDTFSLDFAFSLLMARGNVSNATSGLSGLKADQHFFVYQNILLLIAFIISHRLFADELVYAPNGATVVPIIILVDKTQLLLILGDVAFIPTTKIRDPLLKSQVYYYCIGKLLSPLENAAKSRILLACADGRIRQCYPTICAILADYEEQVLLTGVKKNRYCTRCTRCLDKGHDDFVHLVDCFRWKHYNFNIHVSLATDTLHLLLKGLVMKMLDFMQDMLDDIYPSSRKTWDNSTTLRFCQVMHSTSLKRFNNKRAFIELIAVVSLLFVLKAPFALHFIRASHDEDTLAYIQGALERMNVFKEEFRVYQQTLGEEKNFNYPKWHALTHIIQDIRMYRALDSICTGANSEAYYITIRTALLAADYATVVKQSRPSTTVDIQDRTYSTRVTRPLPFRRLGWLILGIQPYSTKLPLSEVAANIAISNFTHAAAVFVGCMSVQIYSSIKCWRSSSKRHNDSKHCDEEVLYLILIIIDYICYDKDGKHMAYIGAFSKVLLFNNNGQIDNTTRMLSVRRRAWNAAPKRQILQAFKFYDLSTIIRPVHLVPRDLPNLTTRTTMSYYVNNYIDWDEYNRLYLLTFDIDLLRTLREY
ncbi:hypothetical protein HBI55_204150 [Parastagonospora nodorum]|nr:hypothetical protein HBI55_204150 [Parastagonospora nodorum]